MIKPARLRPGDKIGIIAPSFCGPAVFPHRVERGIEALTALGYQVVLAPHAGGRRGGLSGTPAERVADIHTLFADGSVKAIVAAIGGDHSCHLLPLLDYDLIRANPKILMGYSDVTVLNLAIFAKTGLHTFNGPALMTDLAEFPKPFAYTVEYMQRALAGPSPVGTINAATHWTDERLDWGEQLDLSRPRALYPSEGWHWLRGGHARGRLIGGCLESMQHLRGTPYWPSMEDAILFIETSETVPSPAWIDAVLQDYANMGVFDQITGLLVGRPMGYTPAQRQALREVLLERTTPYGFPVVSDLDFGHTAPQFTLPIGCEAEIDGEAKRFAITEAAVK